MGITEVTVPKQYVLVQATEPTGAFEGQLWYDSTNDLTYIFQDDDWQLITLDISQEVLDLATENAEQQLEIIELQANASVTPFDHDTLISDTFSDADGYKDSVNTDNTDATFNSTKYQRNNAGGGLLTNLIAYYKLDETTGTTTTDAQGNTNGTYTGTFTLGETGKLNTAVDFAGTGYSILAENNDFKFTTGNFSVFAWIKTSSASNQVIMSCYSDNIKHGWELSILSTGQIRTSTNESIVTSSGLTLTDGNWHYVGFIKTGTTIKIYADNTEVATGTPTQNSYTGTTYPTIGAYTSASETPTYNYKFNGLIDELGVWNTNLSTDDITYLYNSGDALAYPFSTEPETSKTVEIDLPTITGTVTHTELVINGTVETGASITYKLNNGTTDDTEETLNTKNAYNLTGVPTKLKILLNPKEESPTSGNPSIKSYCLKLWKA